MGAPLRAPPGSYVARPHAPLGTTQVTRDCCLACAHYHCQAQAQREEDESAQHEHWLLWHLAP